jgi:hypothetical protein
MTDKPQTPDLTITQGKANEGKFQRSIATVDLKGTALVSLTVVKAIKGNEKGGCPSQRYRNVPEL